MASTPIWTGSPAHETTACRKVASTAFLDDQLMRRTTGGYGNPTPRVVRWCREELVGLDPDGPVRASRLAV
ncbi:hypothetical protein ACJ8C5_27265 [Klebsiella pneumoniae]